MIGFLKRTVCMHTGSIRNMAFTNAQTAGISWIFMESMPAGDTLNTALTAVHGWMNPEL